MRCPSCFAADNSSHAFGCPEVSYPNGASLAVDGALGPPVTVYPDDNPKTQFGVKKTPLHLVPTVGIEAEAWAFQCGADKYGEYNWREKTISSSVYYAAALRHLQAWWNGEENDPESGHPHLGHARACLNMILDGALHGKLNDNRPPRATKETK